MPLQAGTLRITTLRTVLLAALALFPLVGHTQPEDGASEDPVELARVWLQALRDQDRWRLRSFTGHPFTIRGFNLPTGPEAERCGSKPYALKGVRFFDPNGGIEIVAPDEPSFEEALGCILQDAMLMSTIPPNHDEAWPRRIGRDARGVMGVISVVKPARVSKRLSRYRRELRTLSKNHTLVQATMTDNSGITNTVVLAIRPDEDGEEKVFAVFVDERFRC
jgi:hypothetical protein